MDLLKPGVTSGGLERVDHGDTAQDPLALVAGAADARAVRVAQPLRHPHCSHTPPLSPSRAVCGSEEFSSGTGDGELEISFWSASHVLVVSGGGRGWADVLLSPGSSGGSWRMEMWGSMVFFPSVLVFPVMLSIHIKVNHVFS